MENNRRDTKTSLAFLNVKCLPVYLSRCDGFMAWHNYTILFGCCDKLWQIFLHLYYFYSFTYFNSNFNSTLRSTSFLPWISIKLLINLDKFVFAIRDLNKKNPTVSWWIRQLKCKLNRQRMYLRTANKIEKCSQRKY